MMRVSLMNLGESTRVFHNRLGKAVTVPVGRCVVADLPGSVIQGLKFPTAGETVLVRDETASEIPQEVQGILDILHVLEFESYESLLRAFFAVAPPNNMLNIRPSRQQIRVVLRTMVEDWITAQHDLAKGEPTQTPKQPIHDDVDPKTLERELERNPPQPKHPLQKEADAQRALNGGVRPEPPPSRPPTRVHKPEAPRARARAGAGSRKRS